MTTQGNFEPGAIVVEVLSDSTEAFDRGDKFEYYRSFETIREVIFVSQKGRHVERYVRASAGEWTLSEFRGGEVVAVDAVGVRFGVDELYNGTAIGT